MSKPLPTLTIDTLNLRLPQGFEQRAETIAREVARQLAKFSLPQSGQYPQVSVPSVTLNGGETDQSIARQISHGIVSQLRLQKPSGGNHGFG